MIVSPCVRFIVDKDASVWAVCFLIMSSHESLVVLVKRAFGINTDLFLITRTSEKSLALCVLTDIGDEFDKMEKELFDKPKQPKELEEAKVVCCSFECLENIQSKPFLLRMDEPGRLPGIIVDDSHCVVSWYECQLSVYINECRASIWSEHFHE